MGRSTKEAIKANKVMRWPLSILIGASCGVVGTIAGIVPTEHSVLSAVISHHSSLASVPVSIRIAVLVILHSPAAYMRIYRTCEAMSFSLPWAMAFMVLSSGKDRPVSRPGRLPVYVPAQARDELYLVLGEKHNERDMLPSRKPKRCVIPELGVWGGISISGATGSGKTTLMQQLIEQVVNFKRADEKEKCSALFLEVKGNFGEMVCRIAEAAGRAEDVRCIGEWHYNPLGNPHLPSSELGDAIGAFMAEVRMSGGALEAFFWRHAGASLNGNAIEALRLAGEVPTLAKVFRLIGDQDAMQEKLTQADVRINGYLYFTFDKKQRRDHEEKIAYYGGLLHADDGLWWVPYRVGGKTLHGIADYCHPANGMKGRKKSEPDLPHGVGRHGGMNDQALSQRLETLRFDIDHVWDQVPSERWAEIALSSAQTLKLFENPEIKEIFCPEPTDPKLLPPMDELLDSGKLVVVRYTATDEKVSKLCAAMLKLDCYRAIQRRFERPGPHRRTAIFVDEYQKLAGEKDPDIGMLCRAVRFMRVLAFHGLQSLELTVGRSAAPAIFDSCNSRVFFSTNDLKTADQASGICGTHKVWRPTPSMSQGKGNRQSSASVSGTRVDEPIFKKEFFLNKLRVGKCVAITWNGEGKDDPAIVHVADASLPIEERYKQSALERTA